MDEENGKMVMTDIIHEGRRTHYIGKYKADIKTDMNVSINKSEYEILRTQLRTEFDPIVIKQSYGIDNKVLKNLEDYGSIEDRQLVDGFLIKKPAKPHITLQARTE